MMRITRDEAMSGLVDFSRIRQMLLQIGDRIEHRRLGWLSPLSAPCLRRGVLLRAKR